MRPTRLRRAGIVALLSCATLRTLAQQAPPIKISATTGTYPNLAGTIDRPLRYSPEGSDFVIVNGTEFFNRPLYGGNTAFRVDAGDRPELALYLPGRGGNLRLGLKSGSEAKWLHEAGRIVARYRPGTMSYEVRDALLGQEGVLHVDVVALHATEGVIVRATRSGDGPAVRLIWAYGGVNGQRGRRDGDIGTEAVPISEYFQLTPEACRGNAFALEGDGFTLRSRAATIVGAMPRGATLAIGDATHWSSALELLAPLAQPPDLPVMTGSVALENGPLFLALQRVSDTPTASEDLTTYQDVTAARPGLDRSLAPARLLPAYATAELPSVFAEAEAHFASLRSQLAIETPDPYLNAAVGALNVAADAVWDEPSGSVQHGAVAWRTRLLGWRGPYAMDALGWHDRARRHLIYWAGRQNTDPIPAALPGPDEDTNLARSEAALHSNGDMSNSHYDMNLVYIDALFRHLLWTGDLELARQLWPTIERHLAWERRLFRREFGPERLPLYEAYAAIWASDDLEYHGGGVTHASAYNYWHNHMAARVARLLGLDASPYEREAELIAKGAHAHLWLEDQGAFAEFKDLLGLQRVHPSAGLWTFYHALDAGLPTAIEAWRMSRDVDTRIPHLPVRGPGVPENLHVLSTSDWMPYSWSINNVVFAENVHAALAYWQAGRADEAFRLAKGALLASMYMGICPGNVGSMNYLDVYRRESQRDFADPAGVLSRALVEGLFGVKPDALAGELRIQPGFPAEWAHARLRHPNVSLAYDRRGAIETFVVEPHFSRPQALRLVVPARGARVASVTVNGRNAAWHVVAESVGAPRIEIQAAPAPRQQIVIAWSGAAPRTSVAGLGPGVHEVVQGQMRWRSVVDVPRILIKDPVSPVDWIRPRAASSWSTIDLEPILNDRLTQIFKHEYRSPRSPYVSLAMPKQGLGAWAGSFAATAEIDDTGLRAAAASGGGRVVLPNGLPFATAGPGEAKNVAFTSQWDNFPRELSVPLRGSGSYLYLLMAGTTNHMQSRLDNGEIVVAYTDGSSARLALENPGTWWPIEQDYFVDDFAFARPGPIPPRVDLKTGSIRLAEIEEFKGRGGPVIGGAATVLDLPLDPKRQLASLTLRTLANEVVIGLVAATLER
jgi:Domain of unknown function (DUF4450)